MNSLSMICLPPETLQRMYAQRQQPSCGGERSERLAALAVVGAAVLAALLFALLGS